MNNFPLMLLLCLGALGFVVVGSYAFDTEGGGRPQLSCASDDASGSCIHRAPTP